MSISSPEFAEGSFVEIIINEVKDKPQNLYDFFGKSTIRKFTQAI